MLKRAKAAAANANGLKRKKQGRLKDAWEQFEKASALDPGWSVPLYNLGLLAKERRDWPKCLNYNRLATERDPQDKAAWWNQGIAATALGRWGLARRAWAGFGIDMPAGEGPIDFPCGACPVRLCPDGNPEVVWAHRIDPARAVLDSIPFPESRYRWRDTVLNDGAPVGYRTHEGREVPVFNALQLLEASSFGTFVARVEVPDAPELIAQLGETAAAQAGCAEDWSTSVRMLCKACSEGRVHAKHDTQAVPPGGVHLIGIAAKNHQHAAEILNTWQASSKAICVLSLDQALAP